MSLIVCNDCGGDNNIFIPNVFSPNNDQINDLFFFSYSSEIQLTSIVGNIYDRWGNLVFSITNIPFAWDGKFGGNDVSPGVYVYQLQIIYMIGGEERIEVLARDVTLLR